MNNGLKISLFLALAITSVRGAAYAEDTTSSVYQAAEDAMHGGLLADSERILLQALAAAPDDDRARFQLGVVQVFRAVENLGTSMYQYGAISEKATELFLRIPVPRNPKPATISHQSLGRILDLFAFELCRAERTLSLIDDPDVILPLRLAPIKFSFTADRTKTISLLEILERLNGRSLRVFQTNEQFMVHFDRGDVSWLRGYCHLLSGLVDAYRSVDGSYGFEYRVSRVFPKIEPTNSASLDSWYRFLPIADAPRLHRMRMHFISVCQLNHETWRFIREETDDKYEWLPRPGQTDQLGLPITEQQIDAWLAMMKQLEGALTGELLIPSNILLVANSEHPQGQGLNLAKLLDNPPKDLLNIDRVQRDGINPAYLESEKDKKVVDILVLARAISLFNGPFGIFSAARMN